MRHRFAVQRRFGLLGVVLLWASVSFAADTALAPVADANLLPNPGFEEVADGLPAGWQTSAPSRLSVTTDAKAGKYSTVLEPREEPTWNDAIVRGNLRCAVTLQPGRYVLSGLVRGQNITKMVPACAVSRGGKREDIQPSLVLPGNFDWRPFRVFITLPADAEKVEPAFSLWFFGPRGQSCIATVDDVSLTPTTQTRNFIRNGSFEQTSLVGIPDYWRNTSRALYDPAQYDAKVVEDTAVSGKRSLCLLFDTPAYDDFARRKNFVQSMFVSPQRDRAYTLSVWLKSDPPGVPVDAILNWGQRQTFRPTGEWQRYNFTAVWVKKDAEASQGFVNFMIGGKDEIGKPFKAKVWIDDVQVEEGEAVSPWSAAPEDLPQDAEPQDAAGVAAQPPDLPPLPSLKAERAGAAPRIDGVLDEDCWQKSGGAGEFMGYQDRRPATATTVAKVAFDDQALYVAFTCRSTAAPRAEATERDGSALFGDDVVEFFFDPNPTGATYYHWAWNARGTTFDERITWDRRVMDVVGSTGKQVDRDWNASVEAAAKTGPDGWTLEARIPLYQLAADCPDPARAHANFCRENPANGEVSCWSFTNGSFHTPERFGRLDGWAPDLSAYRIDMSAPRFSRDWRNQALRGVMQVKAASGAAIGCEVAHLGVAETALTAERQGDIVTVAIPSALLGQAAAAAGRIRVRALTPDGRPLAERVFPVQAPALWYFACSSLAFADEKQIPAVAEVFLPAAETAELQVNLRLLKGWTPSDAGPAAGAPRETPAAPVASQPAKPGRNELAFPFADLAPGYYTLVGELADRQGQVVATARRTVAIQPARPNYVRFNPRSFGLEKDGKPWTPVALGFARQQDLPAAKAHGFNMAWYSPLAGTNTATRGEPATFFPAAAAAGVSVIIDFGSFLHSAKREKLTIDAVQEKLREFVEAYRQHPAVGFYQVLDEPEVQRGRKDAPICAAEDLTGLYAFVKELDPYHPVFVNWGPSVAAWNDLSYTDFMAYDYYSTVISPTERTFDRHNYFDENALRRTMETGKPFFKWVEFDHGCTELGVRLMRPVELRCVAYLSLINGARALSYFYHRPWNDDAWDEMTRIGTEIEALTPVLGAPDAEIAASCADSAVRVLLKFDQGKYWLLVANTAAQPKTAEVCLAHARFGEDASPLFAQPPACREPFGRASGEFRDGNLQLPLEPYGVRAFELTPQK